MFCYFKDVVLGEVFHVLMLFLVFFPRDVLLLSACLDGRVGTFWPSGAGA